MNHQPHWSLGAPQQQQAGAPADPRRPAATASSATSIPVSQPHGTPNPLSAMQLQVQQLQLQVEMQKLAMLQQAQQLALANQQQQQQQQQQIQQQQQQQQQQQAAGVQPLMALLQQIQAAQQQQQQVQSTGLQQQQQQQAGNPLAAALLAFASGAPPPPPQPVQQQQPQQQYQEPRSYAPVPAYGAMAYPKSDEPSQRQKRERMRRQWDNDNAAAAAAASSAQPSWSPPSATGWALLRVIGSKSSTGPTDHHPVGPSSAPGAPGMMLAGRGIATLPPPPPPPPHMLAAPLPSMAAPTSMATSTDTLRCEPCGKSFEDRGRMMAHASKHERCSECGFEGSGRVVRMHRDEVHGISMSAASGKTAADLPPGTIRIDTPEELAKWIQDRKRRYPTDANIARKAQEQQNRAARGELVRKQPPSQQSQGGQKRGARDLDSSPPSASDRRDNDEDDNSDEDDSDDEAGPEEHSTKRPRTDTVHQSAQRPPNVCHKFAHSGTCRFGSSCHYSHDADLVATYLASDDAKAMQTRRDEQQRDRAATSRLLLPAAVSSAPGMYAGRGARLPLLARLVDREQRNEHSQLLQCVRFICNNRFFDQGLVWSPEDDWANPPAAAAAGDGGSEMDVDGGSDADDVETDDDGVDAVTDAHQGQEEEEEEEEEGELALDDSEMY
ncbi:hypothetical protein BC828DRAFT_378705 [Blastocladiella britannica]|nr:hypothetical protein BC828DRAFT_378705 [Blastocladiella britannica]